MKRISSLFIIILLLFLISLESCKDDPISSNGDCPASERTGAVCNDGTTSTATGSGACSGHGGVDHWICN